MSAEPVSSRLTHYRSRTALTVVVAAALSLQTCHGQSDEPFEYRGVKYLMAPYSSLFDAMTPLGQGRQRLFVEYLKSSTEGLERVKRAMTDDPVKVWATLDAEETTTFLAVTAAASGLTSAKSGTMLSWFEKLEQIHGSAEPGGGIYPNNQAFRLYLRLSKDGIAYVSSGGTFTDTCTNRDVRSGGLGSRHPDFCRPSRDFDKQKPTRNNPRVQINVTPSNGCADVDLDYDYGNAEHLTKDNSNVLGTHPDLDPGDFPPHLDLFEGQYCQIGFRRAQP